MKNNVFILLDQGPLDGVIRVLTDRVDARLLDENRRSILVTLARESTFTDPRYGVVELTRDKFLAFIRNFKARTYGQEIFLDVAHKPENGQAARVKDLFLDGKKLRAEVEFTEYGREAVQRRGFIYLSIDFCEDYKNPETGQAHGPLLRGAGLTIRPVVKWLDPVQLSLDAEYGDVRIAPRIHQLFAKEQLQMNEFLKKLRAALEAKKLSEGLIVQILGQFETSGKALGDNQPALQALFDGMSAVGVQLAEALSQKGVNGDTLKLDLSGISLPGKTLSEDDVKAMFTKLQEKAADDARKQKETLTTRVKLFVDTVSGAEGLKSLSEDQRNTLLSAKDLITAETTEDQVKRLAENQITVGGKLAAAVQLSAMGFRGGQGTPHISMDESNTIKALQEMIDKRLGITGMPASARYSRTGGVLQEANKKFAEKALEQYDELHAADLHRDHKVLAGGDGIISDVAVPPSWERTVLREALFNMVGLGFVNVDTAVFNSSISVPYSYRDTTAAGRGNTRVYEGGSIKRAGVIQTAELAYPIPQKIAFEVSDEMRYLTASRQIDWEAVSENQRNASRIIAEDLEQLIHNELLQASDEYGAVAVVNESISSRINGVLNTFILAHFPVVRPRKVYDLKGNQIGNTLNPIVVTYTDSPAAAGAILEYNGTNTQAAGVYYRLDYNLGEIQLVSELGAVILPADADSLTVSYSYVTNVVAFDTDLGAAKAEDHYDTFLYKFGLRIAELKNTRYHTPNFSLMSGTVKTMIEQAKKFAANYRVPGTSLENDGNLGRIKDVPAFDTQAPGIWMGDQRVVIGERAQTRLRMMKPWSMGELENQKDSNGRFTGKKEAYGDQFLVLHSPTQLKNSCTSMALYSGTARVDRTV